MDVLEESKLQQRHKTMTVVCVQLLNQLLFLSHITSL